MPCPLLQLQEQAPLSPWALREVNTIKAYLSCCWSAICLNSLLTAISEGSLLALLMPSRESRGNPQKPPGGYVSWFVWRKPATCLATKIVRYGSATCWGGLFSCRYYVGEFHTSRLRLACNASPSLGHGFLIICPSRLGSCLVPASVIIAMVDSPLLTTLGLHRAFLKRTGPFDDPFSDLLAKRTGERTWSWMP